MKDTIFKSTQAMPPTSNSPDVLRTALSYDEYRDDNQTPAIVRMSKKDVVNIERPVRGRPY